MKRLLAILCILAMVLCIAGCDSSDYKKAQELYDNGDYLGAAAIFEQLGDYEDSPKQLNRAKYAYAEELLEEEDFDEALEIFTELDDYSESQDKIAVCNYGKGKAAFEAGDFKAAAEYYASCGDYEDAQAQAAAAELEQMKLDYAPVLAALDNGIWYYDDTSVNVLNSLTFSGTEAILTETWYDGNGRHPGEGEAVSFTVDDSNITIQAQEPLVIPYQLTDDKIELGTGDYFSVEQAEEAIQGYWKLYKLNFVLGRITASEYNMYIENGTIKEENASTSAYGNGYFYYGPHEGTYVFDATGLVVTMHNGDFYGILIEEGVIVPCQFANCFKPSDGLPGEDGYNHLS